MLGSQHNDPFVKDDSKKDGPILKTSSTELGAGVKEKPAYVDAENCVRNLHGEALQKKVEDLEAWLTDELYLMRCPHPPSACKMATRIRQVKSTDDSIGGSLSCMCTGVPAA